MNAPLDAAVAPYVLSHTDDGVCRLTLNRGERYNPLSRAMIAALQDELTRIAAEPSIRCVVLAAEGKGFCAGHDLKELRAHADLAWQQEHFAACNALMLLLTTLPQPVIARVHGIATPAVAVARNVGRKRTMEMLLTGEPIDAATALAWGLVNRVVPAVALDAAI